MSTPLIAAFDIATATGVCHGTPGSIPRVFTWYLSDAGDLRAYKLCYFRNLLDEYFRSRDIRAVYYEQPVNLRAMMRLGATEETISLLRGAVGVLEACAVHAGIEVVQAISVQDARQTLTGHRRFAKINGKSKTKEIMIESARSRGIFAQTDHEADAYAVWWHASRKHLPKIAAIAS